MQHEAVTSSASTSGSPPHSHFHHHHHRPSQDHAHHRHHDHSPSSSSSSSSHRPPPPRTPLPASPPSAPAPPPPPPAHAFSLPYKRSQRPSWSCTECARRKIKCDKRIPCSQCVRRKCPDRCRLEGSNTATPTPTPASAAAPPATPALPSDPSQRTPKTDPYGASPSPSAAAASTSAARDLEQHHSHRRTSSDAADERTHQPTPRPHRPASPANARQNGHHDRSPPSTAVALERLWLQLDRIETRLGSLEARQASTGDLHARIHDVEEVISMLGERRMSRERSGRGHRPLLDAPNGRPTSPSDHLPYSQDGVLYDLGDQRRAEAASDAAAAADVDRPSGGLSAWSDGPASHVSDGEGEQQRPAGQRRPSDEEVEAWRENRNAELAAEDAATALEFFALGKDRRQGIITTEADAEVQVGSDGEPTVDPAPAVRHGQRRPAANDAALAQAATPRTPRSPAASAADATTASSSSIAERLERIRSRLPNAAALSERVQLRLDDALRVYSDDEPWPSNILGRPAARAVPDTIIGLDLSAPSIRSIVRMAKEFGAWQHCCVHFPTFEREVEAFLVLCFGADRRTNTVDVDLEREAWSLIDPAWLSLFCVVMSIAIHQMSLQECRECGIDSAEQQAQQAASLLSAAMESLSLADYLVRPAVYCCQTIAILCVAGHNICGSDLLTSLLAIGIKTGQTLNLHALGRPARILGESLAKRTKLLERERERERERDRSQSGGHSGGGGQGSGSSSDTGSCRVKGESLRHFATWRKRIVDLEVGKRVWWAFTQQDHFAIPYRGCYAIFEGQYDTPLPHNCSDEDLEDGRLINRDVSVLTVASKQRYTCHVAKIVCDFFEDLNKSQGTVDFSVVQRHVRRLRQVTDRFTTSCLDHRPANGSSDGEAGGGRLPSYATVMQHYLSVSVSHKEIVMYRAFLSRRISPEDRKEAHDASIETARAILEQLERGLGLRLTASGERLDLRSRAHGGALWTIPYHAVAAATILALDLLRACKTSFECANTDAGREAEQRKTARKDEVERAHDALASFTGKSAIAQRGCQLLSGLLEEARKWDDKRPGAAPTPLKRKVAAESQQLQQRWGDGSSSSKRVKRGGSLVAPGDGDGDGVGRAYSTAATASPGDGTRGTWRRSETTHRRTTEYGPTDTTPSSHDGAQHRAWTPHPSTSAVPALDDDSDLAAPPSTHNATAAAAPPPPPLLNPLAGDATSTRTSFLYGLSPFPPAQHEYLDLFGPNPFDSSYPDLHTGGEGAQVGGGGGASTSPSSLATASPFGTEGFLQTGSGAGGTGTRPYAPTPAFDGPTPEMTQTQTQLGQPSHFSTQRGGGTSHSDSNSNSNGWHAIAAVGSLLPAHTGGGGGGGGSGSSSTAGGGTQASISHNNNNNDEQHQQQLSHILPALESMPDVWRLFDGSLGSQLVEFQENGF